MHDQRDRSAGIDFDIRELSSGRSLLDGWGSALDPNSAAAKARGIRQSVLLRGGAAPVPPPTASSSASGHMLAPSAATLRGPTYDYVADEAGYGVGFAMIKLHGYAQFLMVFDDETKYLLALVPCAKDGAAAPPPQPPHPTAATASSVLHAAAPTEASSTHGSVPPGTMQFCYDLEGVLHHDKPAEASAEGVRRVDEAFAHVRFQRFMQYEFPYGEPSAASDVNKPGTAAAASSSSSDGSASQEEDRISSS